MTNDLGPSHGDVARSWSGGRIWVWLIPKSYVSGTLRRYNKVRVFRLITFRQNTNHNVDLTHLICHRSVPKMLIMNYSWVLLAIVLLGQGSIEIELCVNKFMW